MTDKEIIQALECCGESSWIFDCEGCPCYDKKEDIQTSECQERIMKNALDLINRQHKQLDNYSHNVRNMSKDFLVQRKIIQEQRAEIESLNIRLRKERHQYEDVARMYDVIKAEAIKECLDRIKSEMIGKFCLHFDGELTNAIIDKVLKEKVGEGK